MVKPYHILTKDLDFCRKASLPFPGEMDLGSGITFEILPMFVHGLFKIYYNIYKKEIHCDDLEDGYNVVNLQRKIRGSNI